VLTESTEKKSEREQVRKRGTVFLIPVLLLVLVRPAMAQTRVEVAFHGGASVFNDKAATISSALGDLPARIELLTGSSVGVTGTFFFRDHFGTEVAWLFQNNDLRVSARDPLPFGITGSATVDLRVQHVSFSGLVSATGREAGVRPFFSAGIGAVVYQPTAEGKGVVESVVGVRPRSDTRFAFNVGAGVRVRVAGRFGLRWDIRDYISGIPDFGLPGDILKARGKFHNLVHLVGVSFIF